MNISTLGSSVKKNFVPEMCISVRGNLSSAVMVLDGATTTVRLFFARLIKPYRKPQLRVPAVEGGSACCWIRIWTQIFHFSFILV